MRIRFIGGRKPSAFVAQIGLVDIARDHVGAEQARPTAQIACYQRALASLNLRAHRARDPLVLAQLRTVLTSV